MPFALCKKRFPRAPTRVASRCEGISDIIYANPGLVNVDFADVAVR